MTIHKTSIKINLDDVEVGQISFEDFSHCHVSSCKNYILLAKLSTVHILRFNNSSKEYFIIYSLTLESEITSIFSQEINESFIDSNHVPKWICFCIGLSNGKIIILNEFGYHLIELRFKEIPIQKIDKVSQKNNPGGEFIYFLYSDFLIELSFDQLSRILQKSILFISGYDANKSDKLDYRRIRFKEHDYISNMIPLGHNVPDVIDHYYNKTISTGRVNFPDLPTIEAQFFIFGSSPSIGMHSVFLESENFSFRKLASNLKNQAISAIFSYAKRESYNGEVLWKKSGIKYEAPICEWINSSLDPSECIQTAEMIYAIADSRRKIYKENPIEISENKKWLAVHDNLARILLIDRSEGTCFRMLKGYRKISMKFFFITHSVLGNIDFLFIHDQLRSVLQVFHIPQGEPVVNVNLPSDDYNFLTISISPEITETSENKSLTAHDRYINFVSNDGSIYQLKFSIIDFIQNLARAFENEEKDIYADKMNRITISEFTKNEINYDQFSDKLSKNFNKYTSLKNYHSAYVRILSDVKISSQINLEKFVQLTKQISNTPSPGNSKFSKLNAIISESLKSLGEISTKKILYPSLTVEMGEELEKFMSPMLTDRSYFQGNHHLQIIFEVFYIDILKESVETENNPQEIIHIFYRNVIPSTESVFLLELKPTIMEYELVEMGSLLFSPTLSDPDHDVENFMNLLWTFHLNQEALWNIYLSWLWAPENASLLFNNVEKITQITKQLLLHQNEKDEMASQLGENQPKKSILHILEFILKKCYETKEFFALFVFFVILRRIFTQDENPELLQVFNTEELKAIQTLLDNRLHLTMILTTFYAFIYHHSKGFYDKEKNLTHDNVSGFIAKNYFKSKVNLKLLILNGRKIIQEVLARWIVLNNINAQSLIQLYSKICKDVIVDEEFSTKQIEIFKVLYKMLPFTLYMDNILTCCSWEICQNLNNLLESSSHQQTVDGLRSFYDYLTSISIPNTKVKIGLMAILWQEYLVHIVQFDLIDIMDHDNPREYTESSLETKSIVFQSFKNLFFDIIKSFDYYDFNPIHSIEQFWNDSSPISDEDRLYELFMPVNNKKTLAEISTNQFNSSIIRESFESFYQIFFVISFLLDFSIDSIPVNLFVLFSWSNISCLRKNFSPLWKMGSYEKNEFFILNQKKFLRSCVKYLSEVDEFKEELNLEREFEEIIYISKKWNLEDSYLFQDIAINFCLKNRIEETKIFTNKLLNKLDFEITIINQIHNYIRLNQSSLSKYISQESEIHTIIESAETKPEIDEELKNTNPEFILATLKNLNLYQDKQHLNQLVKFFEKIKHKI